MLEIKETTISGKNPMLSSSKKADTSRSPPLSADDDAEHVFPPERSLLDGVHKQVSLNPYEKGLKARMPVLVQSKSFMDTLASGSRKRHASLSARQLVPTNPHRNRSETDAANKRLMHNSNIEDYELKQAPFNPGQLVFSFICEILPSFTIAPIFVILCYGWTKGIIVASHRALSLYCPSKDKQVRAVHYSLVKRTLGVTLITYATWTAVAVYALYHEELKKDGIDHVELIIFITPSIIRALVVATKYSYFSQQELSDMTAVETWNPTKSAEKMLLAGWCNLPRVFPNLLQREIDLSTLKADVDLNRVHFRLGRGASSESGVESMEVSAMSVVARIVYSKFGSALRMTVNVRLVFFCQLLVAAAPPLARLACSRAPFGTSWQSRLFLVTAFLGTFTIGAVMYLFLMSAYHDFRRRTNASKMMSALVSYPGVPLEDFLRDDGGDKTNIPITGDKLRRKLDSADQTLYKGGFNSGPKITGVGKVVESSPLDGFVEKVFFDIREPNNAYAWLLSRRVLRGTGDMFYDRCKLFVSYYFVTTTLLLVILNVEVWTDVNHFVFGTLQLILYASFISAGFGFAAYESWNMQATIAPDRLMLKKETVMVEKEIIEICKEITVMKQSKKNTSELQDLIDYKEMLSQSVSFLRSGEELIAYEEEICKPREILGYIADKKVVNTVLGAISSGAFLAYQGLTQNGGSYNARGEYTSTEL